jgi:hypothetical protein
MCFRLPQPCFRYRPVGFISIKNNTSPDGSLAHRLLYIASMIFFKTASKQIAEDNHASKTIEVCSDINFSRRFII